MPLPCVFKYVGSNVELFQDNHPYEVDFCGLLPPEAVVQQLQRRVAQLFRNSATRVRWHHAVKLVYNSVELTAKQAAGAKTRDCALAKLKSLQAQRGGNTSPAKRVKLVPVTIHVTVYNPVVAAIRALEFALPPDIVYFWDSDVNGEEDRNDSEEEEENDCKDKLTILEVLETLDDETALVFDFRIQRAAVSYDCCNRAFDFYAQDTPHKWLDKTDATQQQLKSLALIAVTNGAALRYAGPVLQNDAQLVMTAVRHYGSSLCYASDGLKDDFEIVKAAVTNDPDSFKHASARLRGDFNIFKLAVKSKSALAYASEELKLSKEAVLLAVTEHPIALVAADTSIQRDHDFLMLLARQGKLCLDDRIWRHQESFSHSQLGLGLGLQKEQVQEQQQQFADLLLATLTHLDLNTDDNRTWYSYQVYDLYRYSTKTLKSKELVMSFMRVSGSCLHDASAIYKRDKDVVLAAVQRDGCALEWAHEDLKDDADVVRAAVKSDGNTLKHASPRLRDNDEIVAASITATPLAFVYASERFQTREHALKAAPHDPETVLKHDPRWRADFEIVLAAVKASGAAVELAVPELRGNRQIALAAVSSPQDPYHDPAVKYLPPQLQQDEEVALKAVAQHPQSFQYIGKQQFNLKVVCAAVQTDCNALHRICRGLHGVVHRDVVKHAVATFGLQALNKAMYKSFQDDLEIISLAHTVTRRLLLQEECDEQEDAE